MPIEKKITKRLNPDFLDFITLLEKSPLSILWGHFSFKPC